MIGNSEDDAALTERGETKAYRKEESLSDSESRLRWLEMTGGRPGCSSTKGPLDE